MKSQAEAVKEWLLGYRKEEEELDDLIERIRELRGRATSIKAQEITDMPKGPGPDDPMCDYVIRLEALEGSMERRLREHERDRKAIVSLVRKIRRDEEKEVICCKYLYGMDWSDIRERLYKSQEGYYKKPETYERRMYRAHERALEWMGRHWEKK